MVYLIHFDQPYHHAKHYIGWTESEKTLDRRMSHHRNGTGANLMKVVTQAGITWNVVRTWDDGDRRLERRLKNRKDTPCFCPICNPSTWEHNGNGGYK